VSFFSRDSMRVEDGAGAHARSFSDFAVLSRTEAAGEAAFEALERLGIPCRHAGARRLLERPGVREAVAALLDPSRGGPGSVSGRLRALSRELEGGAAAAARDLAPAAEAFGADLAGFLHHLALSSEVDALDPRADRVSCLTMHAAKGLEFPVVFVLACEDGVIPLRFGRVCEDVEEERRLFFVAATRAGEKLYLCRAKKRSMRGRVVENPPSPFLEDIERELLREASLPDRKRPEGPRQLDLFGP
jgi:superfamily I DNA/RNA helicase